MRVGKAILPKDYTDDEGDILPGAEDRIIKEGETADLSWQFGGGSQTFDPRAQVSPEQSAKAFAMAVEEFKKLSPEERKSTSVGAIAVSINTLLANKNKPVTSAAERLVSKLLDDEPSRPPMEPRKQSKVKSKIAVKQENKPADFDKQIRRAMSTLDIPGLDIVAIEPMIDVELRYTEASQPVSHKFKVHWATLAKDVSDRIVKVNLTFDGRWGDFDFNPSRISFSDESMQVILMEAGDDPQSATVFDAMRGGMTADLGVFHIVTFNGV
jgi:hypothetical protein